jgi:hypothetical protein
MEHLFSFADAFGPSKIVHLYKPTVGLKALEEAAKTRALPRQAAVALAERRVRTAMGYRRWSS